MEAINIFLKKEQDFKMFDRELFGIKYWEFVRPLISCEVNRIISDGSPMFAKNPFNIRKYMINFKYLSKYFLNKQKNDILVISQPRRILNNGKYKNNYIDYYIDYLKKKYEIVTIEEPTWSSLGVSNKPHDFPVYTDNIYFTDLHEIFFLIRKKVYRLFKRKKMRKILEEYNNIYNLVNSWYDGDHKSIDFKNYFIDSMIRLDIDNFYIKKILEKTKPKIVMLHYMPSIFKQMLISNCNNMNIITIEVQHGTITKVDPLVNHCLDVSKLRNDTKYIFSFGKNQVSKYALSIKNMHNVVNIGFPFFEDIMKKTNNKKNKKKYILIISQSTIGDSIANFTSDLADLLNGTEYKIVFKYHPNEMSKNYLNLKKNNIIEIKNEKSIYEIQRESILQIGVYSTSLYEGFALKVPTLIIEPMFGSVETLEVFENINRGVYYIKTPNDVLKYLERNDIIPLEKDIKKLWQYNSKENLLREIFKLLGR